MSPTNPVYRDIRRVTTGSPSVPPEAPSARFEQVSSLDAVTPTPATPAADTPFRVLGQVATEGATSTATQPFTRDSLAELLDIRARWRSAASLDPLGMFILHTVSAAENGIPLADVAENLRGPAGWVAVARLIRAGLLDENGLTIYATPSGRSAAEATQSLASGPNG